MCKKEVLFNLLTGCMTLIRGLMNDSSVGVEGPLLEEKLDFQH